MRYLKIALLAALAVAAAGCSWRMTPVGVVSETGSVAALVGHWEGEYASAATGRSGSITFELASERDTAYGDVVMVPRASMVQVASGARETVPGAAGVAPPAPQPLSIRFVRLESGNVSGRIAPYADPECGCPLFTTFEGRFDGPNRIKGTFTTRGSDSSHPVTGGEWHVTRKAGS